MLGGPLSGACGLSGVSMLQENPFRGVGLPLSGPVWTQRTPEGVRLACARRVYGVCTACLRRVHGVCTACARRVHGVCTAKRGRPPGITQGPRAPPSRSQGLVQTGTTPRNDKCTH